jgi:hydrogenase expression/formation protein HypD
MIDKAVEIAARGGTTVCAAPDLLAVSGRRGDLRTARAAGADVRPVDDPLEAVAIARRERGRPIVLFAAGFEDAAPGVAAAVLQAESEGLHHLSFLSALALMCPAIEVIVGVLRSRVSAFLVPGPLCSDSALHACDVAARRARVPVVVAGPTPTSILTGLLHCVRQLEEGRAELESLVPPPTPEVPGQDSRHLIAQVFRVIPWRWRGIGLIPRSGLGLRPRHAAAEAEARFGAIEHVVEEDGECRRRSVFVGEILPPGCAAFGVRCTPEAPLGILMSAPLGTCSLYHRHRWPARAAV